MKSYTAMIMILFSLSCSASDSEEPSYKVKWKTKNKQIVLSSVCYNYQYGSLDSRGCRSQAKQYFKEKCSEYTQKYKDARSSLRGEFKSDKDKYCIAARKFKPIQY